MDGRVRGDGARSVRGFNSLAHAESDDITLLGSPAFAAKWSESKAAAALVDVELENHPALEGDDRPLIIVDRFGEASAKLLQRFAPPSLLPEKGVHETAWVHPSAVIGRDVRIAAHVSIERDARVGDRTVLHAGARLYAETVVGADCEVHSNTVIRERCTVGDRVTLHSNVSIGTDGFGYAPNPDGSGQLKLPHLGTVQIEDDVEIGANSCVDRGKFGPTVIGRGTKIDNQVQIGHNCVIGRHCLIAGQVGIAGSVEVGDWVRMAGGVGVADHLTIGPHSTLGAAGVALRDVPEGQLWTGYPAAPSGVQLRQWAAIRKLPGLLQRLARQTDEEADGRDPDG